MSWFLPALARKLGYVRQTEMDAAIAALNTQLAVQKALLDDKERITNELWHANTHFNSQGAARDRMEQEIAFLRELELTHARRDSSVCKAVDRFDEIAANLLTMMRDVWPDAYLLPERAPSPA